MHYTREIVADHPNEALNERIERMIDLWSGTIFGYQLKNMYENGTNYESICEAAGIDYSDYEEVKK